MGFFHRLFHRPSFWLCRLYCCAFFGCNSIRRINFRLNPRNLHLTITMLPAFFDNRLLDFALGWFFAHVSVQFTVAVCTPLEPLMTYTGKVPAVVRLRAFVTVNEVAET